MSRNTLIIYFTFSILVKVFASSWGGQFLAARIRTGRISPHLIQPIPYVLHYLSNNIAEKLVKFIFLIPIAVAISLMFKADYSIILPINVLLFFITILLSAAIDFLMDICFGLTAFWMSESSSLSDIFAFLYTLFSGALIPLIALPPALLAISHILPFRYTTSLPLEILIGQLSGNNLMLGLTTQCLWLLLMLFIYKLLWQKGLKVYSASGA
jgi:ABC-2 type transport system permease protein